MRQSEELSTDWREEIDRDFKKRGRNMENLKAKINKNTFLPPIRLCTYSVLPKSSTSANINKAVLNNAAEKPVAKQATVGLLIFFMPL